MQNKYGSCHNFAHATTAQLSWHVQNSDIIGYLEFELEQKNVFKTLLRADTFVKRILEHRCSWRGSNKVGLLNPPVNMEFAATWDWMFSIYSICVISPHFTRSSCTNRRATNWHDKRKPISELSIAAAAPWWKWSVGWSRIPEAEEKSRLLEWLPKRFE